MIFKKILLSLLLLFTLLVGLLAIGFYLHLMLEQQAIAFCDAIPLDTTIEAVHFKQTVLHTQPTMIFGRDDINGISFYINARHEVITEQKITASGMDEFLNKAESKQAHISAWFFGFLPFSGYACEIGLVKQRVSNKHVIASD